MNILEKAYLLSLDYPVTSTSLPALPAKRRSPKLIMLDSGLTNYVAGIQLEYLQNKDLQDTWRGRAAEQIVAQELKPVLDRHYKEEQCFWMRDKAGTTAEVDFIWPSMTGIVPIEVKSGKGYEQHRALANIMDCRDYELPKAIVLCNDNISRDGKLVYAPVYMTMFIRKDNPAPLEYKVDLSGII